jgi:hypothetical protein
MAADVLNQRVHDQIINGLIDIIRRIIIILFIVISGVFGDE